MSFTENYILPFDVYAYLTEKCGTVRRSGATNVVVSPCPICGSKEKKFYANAFGARNAHGVVVRGKWNSYCCHRQGGLVDLVAEIEGVDAPIAVGIIRDIVDGRDDDLIPVIQQQQQAVANQPAAATVVFGAELPQPLYTVKPEYPYCKADGSIVTLRDRGIDEYIMERHQLRVTGVGTWYGGRWKKEYDHRLLIPIFGNGIVRTWQARDMTGSHHRNRYVFPPGDCSGSMLYDFDAYLQRGGSTLLIVEGVFAKWAWDCLGRSLGLRELEHMTVASFGKRLSLAQEDLIINTPKIKRVIIGWDLDAAPQIARIADRLNGRKELFIMKPHPERDHDELSIDERKRLLFASEPYTRELAARMVTQVALGGSFVLSRT